MKKILFAASECVPFIKTGGLADVVGSLPKYINKDEFDVRVILPKYMAIQQKYKDQMQFITNFTVNLSWRSQYVGLFQLVYEGVTFYFVDNEFYFSGNHPYGYIHEDIEKFAFFSKAVLSVLPTLDFRPDIIHCHDWQTGLIPVMLHDAFQDNEFYRGIKTVMTIHNLKFQGIWDKKAVMDITGLSEYYFAPDKLEAYGDANYLKGGLVYADRITTVSNSYANEIKTQFYGEGLDGLLNARSNVLTGIVNGIDYNEYDPATDKMIYNNYDAITFRKEKSKNKRGLQQELGLDINEKIFMLGVVSRLTDQKGFDLIDYVIEEICAEDTQFVVLGTGDPKYENLFRHYEWKYKNRVSASIYYNNERSHRIYAACDAFLMPSLFEPCGLSQLMSLRYGTVPIVRETGGLRDTVEPYNQYENSGTGFGFCNYNAHEMLGTIRYAKSVYYDHRREWNKIVDRGMAKDFSWTNSAKQYEELYRYM
ncbi:MAG: glycogen synthase GlgA [Lachnospiraceae bacterium]|nr:glycogen synthase GlgA [Lachnospiraceae bacterium]